MRLLATAALALALAAPAEAQLYVVSSTPQDFAAGVSLATTVAFTFSHPVVPIVGGPAPMPPTVVFLPSDSVVASFPTQSADGRTITYGLTLRPNTRYVALVLEAQGVSSGPLARPFALNFTTAPGNGSFNVSGTVTAPAGTPLDGALVALVSGDVASGTISLAAVEVLTAAGSSESYTLGPVPLTLYTAGAVRLPLYGATPAYGFYDPDGDGTPNPILFPSGVDVALTTPPAATAGAGYVNAASAAESVLAGAYLSRVPSQPVDTTGRAGVWVYHFISAGAAEDADVVQLGPFSLPFIRYDDVVGGPALPVPFVDTDAAVAAAEGAGGGAFRQLHAGRTIEVAVSGVPEDIGSPFPASIWSVGYVAREGPGSPPVASFHVYVDMATGAVLGTTAAEPGAASAGLALEAPAPNPAAGPVAVAYRLDAPGRVRLAVFDALGREVAVLDEGVRAAGRHVVAWRPAPGQAAGLYLLRLDAAGGVAVQTLARTR